MKDFLGIFREIIGFSVALTSMGWVLVHLFSFLFFGNVVIGESNPYILAFELTITITGLFCFLNTIKKHKQTFG
jgi:hypothetical protein